MMAARFARLARQTLRTPSQFISIRFTSSEPSFQQLLENTALFKLDKQLFGRHVEGTIVENHADKITVDVGLKLHGVINRDDIGQATR
jgi:ribosomal protein L35AE/L33A